MRRPIFLNPTIIKSKKRYEAVIHCKDCKRCVIDGDSATCGIDLKAVKLDHFCGYAIENEEKEE